MRVPRAEESEDTVKQAGVAAAVATWVTEKSGSTPAFLMAFGAILVWGALGPVFKFSDTWQLVINTSTTIVTFLMVFLIQRAQNRSGLAVQLKLNEIVAAIDGASNRLVSVEDLSEQELEVLHAHYRHLAKMAKQEESLTQSHSIEEATERHQAKRGPVRRRNS